MNTINFVLVALLLAADLGGCKPADTQSTVAADTTASAAITLRLSFQFMKRDGFDGLDGATSLKISPAVAPGARPGLVTATFQNWEGRELRAYDLERRRPDDFGRYFRSAQDSARARYDLTIWNGRHGDQSACMSEDDFAQVCWAWASSDAP
jgi:hypothetical protein